MHPAALRLLLAALAPGMAAAQAPPVAVVAPANPTLQLVQQAWPAGDQVDIPLDVGGDGTGRLVFSTLRTRATLKAIALLNPQGREVWRRSPAELGAVPRAQTAQPRLGDAVPLPEQPRPAPGRWRLRLERSSHTPTEVLTVGWQLLPRFSLNLWRPAEPPAANQPVLLVVRPTDDGRAVLQATGLQLRLLTPAAPPVVLTPRQDLESPLGGRISQEPGAYLAQWRPTSPGGYDVQATWQPPGAATPLVAAYRVDVAPAAGRLRFAGALPEGPPGCVRLLHLRFDIELNEAPAAASELALAVRVQGAQTLRQFTTSVKFAGAERSTTAEVQLHMSDLRQLGWPLQRVTSSQLTRFVPELRVLFTGEAVALTGPQPPLPLCD